MQETKMENDENICAFCGYFTYLEIDDRRMTTKDDPKRPPTRKCLGCGMTIKNCDCPRIELISSGILLS